MSRYGARNGAPQAHFGMKGRNDGSIRLVRKMAQGHGHHLKPGVVTRDNEGVEVYSARCPCGRAEKHASIDDNRWPDLPAHLVVWIDRVRTEMEYRHGSTAYVAAKRIARSHRLVKMPGRARWRSRPMTNDGRDANGNCIKCGAGSGDDWRQCGGSCPIPMSPHFRPMENFMRIRVASGKYTFVHTRGDMPVEIQRHGEPWVSLHDGGNALTSIMAELDAARVVLASVRDAVYLLKQPDDINDRSDDAIARRGLAAALRKHDALVDDSEMPSAWAR